jgi:hypothetical protein
VTYGWPFDGLLSETPRWISVTYVTAIYVLVQSVGYAWRQYYQSNTELHYITRLPTCRFSPTKLILQESDNLHEVQRFYEHLKCLLGVSVCVCVYIYIYIYIVGVWRNLENINSFLLATTRFGYVSASEGELSAHSELLCIQQVIYSMPICYASFYKKNSFENGPLRDPVTSVCTLFSVTFYRNFDTYGSVSVPRQNELVISW